MNPTETARAIRAEIMAAETALAKADALATAEFRALVAPDDLVKVEAAHSRAARALTALHRVAGKAKFRPDVILPRFGK